jgi:hypothetical protein
MIPKRKHTPTQEEGCGPENDRHYFAPEATVCRCRQRIRFSDLRFDDAADQLQACQPYLKEGETHAECLERNRQDIASLLIRLANAKTVEPFTLTVEAEARIAGAVAHCRQQTPDGFHGYKERDPGTAELIEHLASLLRDAYTHNLAWRKRANEAEMALLTHGAGPGSPWQPMETAPKDETRVLLLRFSGSMPVVVIADRNEHREWIEEGDRDEVPCQSSIYEGWMPLPLAQDRRQGQ